MNRPELYKKTVDILYDAYFNDTLKHGSCCTCVMGNLVKVGLGYRFNRQNHWVGCDGKLRYPHWHNLFCTTWEETETGNEVLIQNINPEEYSHSLVKEEINSVGYQVEELIKIEFAFENVDRNGTKEEYDFNGLVAVLEVLKTIHEVEDNEPEVIRFQNHYNKKCLTK